MKKGRITGIGGIFFKSRSPEKMKDWYARHFGLTTNEYGTLFEFKSADSGDTAYLQWSPMDELTEYFNPSNEDFMINYRVENIEALVEELKEADVEICDEIETYEYGKFVHILDPEGRKIELWEPKDEVFTQLYKDKTTK